MRRHVPPRQSPVTPPMRRIKYLSRRTMTMIVTPQISNTAESENMTRDRLNDRDYTPVVVSDLENSKPSPPPAGGETHARPAREERDTAKIAASARTGSAIAVKACQRKREIRINASAPWAPIRLSFKMASILSRERPARNASATSANPSSCSLR